MKTPKTKNAQQRGRHASAWPTVGFLSGPFLTELLSPMLHLHPHRGAAVMLSLTISLGLGLAFTKLTKLHEQPPEGFRVEDEYPPQPTACSQRN